MEWEGGRESENVEDRRSYGGAAVALGGGGSIVALVLYLIFGGGLGNLFDDNNPGGQGRGKPTAADEEGRKFVAVVLASTEDVWHDLFRKMGKNYRDPKLVLFKGRVQSACGFASAAVGPFYCPPDEHIYLDLEFFRELEQRFRAPGKFAQAYVIAHEVGHHVQKQLGYSKLVDARRGKADENRMSVRLELQADFFAGVWGYHVRKNSEYEKKGIRLNPNDLEDALRAANAIGDDRLQRESQGRVVPDSFTHGTSAQRVRWFRKGFETGDLSQGDTFRLRDDEL
jgi:uncharacterized protein